MTSRPGLASGWARSTGTSRPGQTSSSPSTATRSRPAPRPVRPCWRPGPRRTPPWLRWIDLFVDFLVTKHGLAAALQSDDAGFEALHAYFLDRLVPVCALLLDAAADAGEIRADVDAYELMRGVGSLCAGAGRRLALRRPPHGRAAHRRATPGRKVTGRTNTEVREKLNEIQGKRTLRSLSEPGGREWMKGKAPRACGLKDNSQCRE